MGLLGLAVGVWESGVDLWWSAGRSESQQSRRLHHPGPPTWRYLPEGSPLVPSHSTYPEATPVALRRASRPCARPSVSRCTSSVNNQLEEYSS